MNFAKTASFIRNYSVAVFSFLLIFLLTLFIYQETKKKAEERGEKLFAVRSGQVMETLQARVKDNIQILLGAKALFNASDTVSRENWHAYYNTLNLDQNYPGIQGLGYAEVVYPNELAKHERRIRREGFPEYKIYPEGDRPVYTSIIYLEPFDSRNTRAFGYDMFSDTVRQSAMRIARDTRLAAMSGKVRLMQENGLDEQSGFLIYLPVYKQNAAPASISERQRLIAGYVYSPFRVKDLMASVLRKNYEDLDIEIFDGKTMSKASLLYSTDTTLFYENANSRKFSQFNTLTIGNHTWRMYITGRKSFMRSADADLPNFILLGGSIISLLMFFIVKTLSRSRRSNHLKQTITDNATAGLLIVDAKGFCTFMNPAAEEMTGYTLAEMQHQSLHDTIHHHHPDGSPFEASTCMLAVAVQKKLPLRAHEDVFIRKDGTLFNVMCAARPILEYGMPAYVIMEVRDITDEKRAQQAIIESEARFRAMADSAPVIIWVDNAEGECVYVNKQWADFSGQTAAESITCGWRAVVIDEEKQAYAEALKQAALNAEPFNKEMRLRRFDGDIRWVINTAMPRYGVNGEFLGYIGSIVDITEIKEAERRIKQNAELLQKLFLEVPALVGLVRAPDYEYVLANPPYRQLYGNRPLVGQTIYQAHPNAEAKDLLAKVEDVFKTGTPFVGKEMHTQVDRLNNGKYLDIYFNLVCQPLLDVNNQVEAVLLFAVEVTELVAARKRQLETNDKLSDKNKELQRINDDLDSFVYTASHDLKSPIANMEGLTTLLRDTLDGKLSAEDDRILDMVGVSINKLKQTIADLAEITKVQKDLQLEVEPLAFESILLDVRSDVQQLVQEYGATITANFQVKNMLYTRKNLRSIIYNLVSNGIKYKAPERPPQINISTYQQGEYIVLAVADNGLGIKKEQQHKLFSMFRRLHTHVEGTGIGLYIIKRIIENNGGHIEVKSNLGEGTTFKVYFKQAPVQV